MKLDFLQSRITATSNGYIEQHVKRMRSPDGTEHLVPACIVVTLRDGRLHQAEEYLDSAHLPEAVRLSRKAESS